MNRLIWSAVEKEAKKASKQTNERKLSLEWRWRCPWHKQAMFGVSLLPSPHTSVAAAAEIEEKTELEEEAAEVPWQLVL
jgi:hypothetical protein